MLVLLNTFTQMMASLGGLTYLLTLSPTLVTDIIRQVD